MRAARILQVLVDLAGAADAAERVDKLDRGAPDGLIDPALEGGLVVEERRAVPVHAEQPELVEDHRRDPGILVDIEVDEIGGNLDDGRGGAGLDLALDAGGLAGCGGAGCAGAVPAGGVKLYASA